MVGLLIVLATIMAVFALLGYLSGTRATLVTTLVILFGLLLVARAGGTVARLINGLYFGFVFVFSGGVQALGASGDRAAAIGQVFENMGDVEPLVDPDSVGVELAVLLLVMVLVSMWLGRSERLRLRGPASLGGFLFGLLNGYLIGAYFLNALAPQGAFLPMPFSPRPAAAPAAITPATPAGPDAGFMDQLVRSVTTASDNTLATIAMLLIAVFLIVAVRMATRGAGKAR